YDRLYGSGAGIVSQGIELVTTRVRAVVRLERPPQAGKGCKGAEIPAEAYLERREIFWPDRMERMPSQVFDGSRLRPGNAVCGPAVVELPYTGIAVGVGQTLVCDDFGNFVLRLDQEGAR
ncbi:MAG: hypothetical protein ACPLRM_00725, partial [Anaerolineae bacterium]